MGEKDAPRPRGCDFRFWHRSAQRTSAV